jgi:hypothetical protein
MRVFWRWLGRVWPHRYVSQQTVDVNVSKYAKTFASDQIQDIYDLFIIQVLNVYSGWQRSKQYPFD